MNIRHKGFRPAVAVSAVAVGAALVLAGCSDDSKDDVKDAASNVSSVIDSGASDASTAVDEGKATVEGLDNAKAQELLRGALDPATSSSDQSKYLDTSANPGVGVAMSALAKGFSQAGYTADRFTVTAVKASGDDKATATVSVSSPHSSKPADIEVAYVKVDGAWKVSADIVTQLGALANQHGG